MRELTHSRILLIKPSSLGDIVHTLPIVSALKAQWPGMHITWLVKRQWSEIVERVDGVDRVWPVDMTVKDWLQQGWLLRKQRFDLAIDLQGLFRSGALALLSRAPVRVGFANAREGSPWCYTERVAVPSPDVHAVDRYLSVAKALGASVSGSPRFGFKIVAEDVAVVQGVFQRHGVSIDKSWIAMNVTARWPTKRWPLGSFAAVADQLYEQCGVPIVVLGGPDERQYVKELKALVKRPVIDLSGEVPLRCLPALLSRAMAMITNDSGPMHIAAALNVPVVALFGPTSAIRTGPYGSGHRVLNGQVACSPCFSRVCRYSPQLECLHLVTPTHVVDAVRPLVMARAACP